MWWLLIPALFATALAEEPASPAPAGADSDEGATAGEQAEEVTEPEGPPPNRPPVLEALSIGPDHPRTVDDLRCVVEGTSDPDDDSVTVALSWTLDGEPLGVEGELLSAGETARGDVVACVGVPHDGTTAGEAVTSARLTVENHPPIVTGASVAPRQPQHGDDLTCAPGSARDPDGDEVDFGIRWLVDGEAVDVPGDTYPGDRLQRGQQVVCEVTPHDGADPGRPVASATVEVVDAPPEVEQPAIEPASPTSTDDLRCLVPEPADPDGDPVTLARTWTVRGSGGSHTHQGAELAAEHLHRGDEVRCAVTASDGILTTDPVTSTPVVVGNSPPRLAAVEVAPSTPRTGDDLRCKGLDPTDPDGDSVRFEVRWTVDGRPVEGDDGVLPASATRRGQRIGCTATPRDDADAGASVASAPVTVENTPPSVGPPTVEPAEPTVRDTLRCAPGETSDPDGDSVQIDLVWRAADEQVGEGSTLEAPAFARGDAVRCEAIATDGRDRSAVVPSAAVEVRNAPPVVDGAAIEPATVYADTPARCVPGQASDPDGDEVELQVSWTVDGEPAGGGETLPVEAFERGQSIACSVTPRDGRVAGATARAGPIEVRNAPPTVGAVVLEPAEPRTDDVLTARAETADRDGDAVELSWSWTVDGQPVEGIGHRLDGRVSFDRGQVVRVTATPHDGIEAGEPATSAAVTVRDTAPTAPVVALDDPRGGRVDLVCRIATPAEDADGDPVRYEFTWTTDGEPYTAARRTVHPGDTVPRSAVHLDQAWACVARPTDGTLDGPPSAPDRVTVVEAMIGGGRAHTCALATTGVASCWGNRDHGIARPPSEPLRRLAVGGWHVCAIRQADRGLTCWGHDRYGQSQPPEGAFRRVAAGGWHTCALDLQGRIACFGQGADDRLVAPEGTWTALDAGWDHTCAVRDDGAVRCWGDDEAGQASPPPGAFVEVAAGEEHTCALDAGGAVTCWGQDRAGETRPPEGRFVHLVAGSRFTCGLRDDGSVACWGADNYGQASPPDVRFLRLGAGVEHACGWTDDGRVLCWGHDQYGQTRPP